VSEWYEVAFDRLYPLLYRHRDETEAVRAAETFAPMLTGPGPVLDLACGAGRHMAAFGARGLDMVGLDLSPFLLREAAGDPGPLAGRLVRGDMRVLPFHECSFGAVINMFTSFGYFDDADNQRVLDEVARVLRPGGWFLMDFMNARRVQSSGLARTVREVDGYTIEEDRSVSDDGRYLVKDVRVAGGGEESLSYAERVRLLDPDDLAAMVAVAGLELHQRFGGYDGVRFDPAVHDRVISLYQRMPTSEGKQ
jgi:SAM-dependent methyltransferase